MADYTKYTKQEMQAYAIAKNIKENQIVIVPELPSDRREWSYGLFSDRGSAFCR